jgi:hypothetical protein
MDPMEKMAMMILRKTRRRVAAQASRCPAQLVSHSTSSCSIGLTFSSYRDRRRTRRLGMDWARKAVHYGGRGQRAHVEGTRRR